MNIASKVGSCIRILREAAGLTQSELAATAYVTRQSVGNWGRGNTLPDVQSLQLVAKALNTTVDGLLGDELPDMLEETAEARRQLTHCQQWVELRHQQGGAALRRARGRGCSSRSCLPVWPMWNGGER